MSRKDHRIGWRTIIETVVIVACIAGVWLAGIQVGIRYQQNRTKHPIGNGTAFLYELNGEQEMALDDLKKGQTVVCAFLVERGFVETWIETKSGEQVTSIMSFDDDNSSLFSVPFDGDFIVKIAGKDASVHVGMLLYDETE